MIKNRYLLPLIRELIERILKVKFFTKIDLRHKFYLIRIDEKDEWKTAFKTYYGYFQYRVIPIGLTNALVSFQEMINKVLKPYLDKYAIVYLNNILIYLENLEDHKEQVWEVLRRLQEVNLLVAPKKNEFFIRTVKFLGFIQEYGNVRLDLEKVEAVRS